MRLRHPEQGTVVTVGDDLAGAYLASGWVDADRTQQERKASPRRRKVEADD